MRMTMGSKQQRPISLGLQVCAALGAVCALAGSVCAQGISLDMGGATLKMEPESAQEELAVGRLVAGQILGAAKLLPNAELQRYVNLVGRRVADQSERKDAAWAFGVIDSSAINAFAGPGGKILITSALLQILESEDELAAVLAHEVAHVVRKHHYRVIRKQRMLEFGAQSVAIKEDSSGMSEKLSGMVAQVLARGLDQSAEFEADRDGMVYAARAGYDASALIRVMEKLSAVSAKDPAGELLLSTHPSAENRRITMAKQVNADLEKAATPSRSAARYRQFVK
ncbi:MAG: peptidase [Betaproteobacteria bacterium]|nr:peptidase [Betaproteobacteria bacterium]